MPARLLIILLASLVAAVASGCGDRAGDEDVDSLLQETFSGDKQVDAGRLAVSLAVDARGSGRAEGPVRLDLSGPFQRLSPDDPPRFDLDASLTGAGMDLRGGATSTGDRGYVRLENEHYAISQDLFERFRAGFEKGRTRRGAGDGQSPAGPRLDPRRWLVDAENAGEAQVGGAETIRITGDVDVPRLLDDVSKSLDRARAAHPDHRGDLPTLGEEQRRRIEQAIQSMSLEIHTGQEDRILRRMVITADVQPPAGTEEFDSADVRFAYSLTELNEDQEVSAPADARPFEELERQLRALGLARR